MARLANWLLGLAALLVLLIMLLLAAAPVEAAERKAPLVLAAASLQESLNAAADAWTSRGHPRPILSFGASSALARQISSGAPADLFISADEDWMDYLDKKRLLKAGSRASFLSNRLVLIAPAASIVRVKIARGFPLGSVLGSARLAIADPEAVPAGKYGKAALSALGVWPKVAGKLAPADNVRGALAFVERGEAPLGVVYETDAKASAKVRIVDRFPENSHPRISYPVAVLQSSNNEEAEQFRRFLISAEGKALFRRFGFVAN